MEPRKWESSKDGSGLGGDAAGACSQAVTRGAGRLGGAGSGMGGGGGRRSSGGQSASPGESISATGPASMGEERLGVAPARRANPGEKP